MSKGLILIDIQNDYFQAGAMELVKMEEAAGKCRQLLAFFRERQLPVFHIQHISLRPGATFFLPGTHGCEIHESVKPKANEPIATKHYPSSFRETQLADMLAGNAVDELVICGAMTHMCVDSTTRAAFDLGFKCQVIADGCATKDLVFNHRTVSAQDVNTAFMAALSVPFAEVITADGFIGQQEPHTS